MPAPSTMPPSNCWAKFVYQKISAVAFIEDKQGDLLSASSTAHFAIGSWDDHADNSLSVWAVDGWGAGRAAGKTVERCSKHPGYLFCRLRLTYNKIFVVQRSIDDFLPRNFTKGAT